MAIWCKSKLGGTPPANVELHLNFWKIPNSADDHDRCLDLGIKLDSTTSIEEVKVFLPFQATKKEIEDVANKFVHNNRLIDAIFNENYKATTDSHNKKCKITDSNGDLVFHVYQLSDSDIEVQPKHSGTLLSIKSASCDERIYYRLRIKSAGLKSLSTIQNPANAIFQSAFSKVDVIDFRVNQARDLDLDLLEEMNREHRFGFVKAHFFFICSSGDEILGSHKPFNSCRKLESDLWSNYIDLSSVKTEEAMLAYHWKWDAKVTKDFNVLIKSKFEKNNPGTIVKYLLFIVVIGIAVNLFSSWLYDLGKGSPRKEGPPPEPVAAHSPLGS